MRRPLVASVRPHFHVVDDAERGRIERLLAIPRALLATVALVAILFDPTEPVRYAQVAYALLAFHVVWSLSVFAWLRSRGTVGRPATLVLHAADLLWPAIITSFTAGPSSPLVPFFTFALLAAAYRWGLRQAMFTAALATVILVLQGVAWLMLGWSDLGPFPVNRLIIRISYVFLIALLGGVLADAEKQRRGEAKASAALLSQLRVDLGLRASVGGVLAELSRIFGAPRIELAARDADAGQSALWILTTAPDGSTALEEGAPEDAQLLLSPDLPHAFFVAMPGGLTDAAALVVRDESGEPTPAMDPSALWNAIAANRSAGGPASPRLSVAYSAGRDIHARLMVIGGDIRDVDSDLRLLAMLVQQAAPALHNLYLAGRLRQQIGAIERSRVARELHDGPIQAVLGIEMHVEAIRRQVPGDHPVHASLVRIQSQLHDEAISLRELMQRMHQPDLKERDLVQFLAHTIEKFRRDTGIWATFTSNVSEVALPPATAREIARIVQEGLANIRRHSGARAALVSLRVADGTLTLLIDDDGKGFGFSGRLEGEALDRSLQGPVIIRERAQAIEAALAVESSPRGSRLELVVPLWRRTRTVTPASFKELP